jgi:uncharacterized membrane protein YecN with MAPEG domain
VAVPVTALYAALLALVAIVLSVLVGRERVRSGVSLYEGGDRALAVAIRRHANFTEHVPLALLLLAAIELNGAPPGLLHALGLVLLASRIVHPFGLSYENPRSAARALGALGTLVVTLAAIGVALWQLLSA